MEIVQHVSKNSVSIPVEQIYKTQSLTGNGTCILYIAQAVAKVTQSFYNHALFPNSAFSLPLLKHRDTCHAVYCENTY
jgi:hypothetical protein